MLSDIHRGDIIVVDVKDFRSRGELVREISGDHKKKWWEPSGIFPLVEGVDYKLHTAAGRIEAELLSISPVVGGWEHTRYLKFRVVDVNRGGSAVMSISFHVARNGFPSLSFFDGGVNAIFA